MLPDDQQRTIPLLEEQVHVTKRDIVSDQVRVTTHVEERDVMIEETVARGTFHVERVPVDRAVAEAPEPRQEGHTLIVSIVEERLVVEKRLFVIEELRITRNSTIEHVTVPETVRSMRATITRTDPAPSTERGIDG